MPLWFANLNVTYYIIDPIIYFIILFLYVILVKVLVIFGVFVIFYLFLKN